MEWVYEEQILDYLPPAVFQLFLLGFREDQPDTLDSMKSVIAVIATPRGEVILISGSLCYN